MLKSEISNILLREIEKTLSPIQQKVLKLYYLEQQGKKNEIAQDLNMSVSRFKGILDTAKNKLKERKILKEYFCS